MQRLEACYTVFELCCSGLFAHFFSLGQFEFGIEPLFAVLLQCAITRDMV